MQYYIGIDIGTTAVKTVAFSAAGKVLGEQTTGYPIHHPFPDWSEQDPEEIFRAVVQTVEDLLQDMVPNLPNAVGFSSAMHSLIAVNETGQAISPCIIWADNRAATFAEKIKIDHLAKEFYTRTGVPVHPMSPCFKLFWIKDNQSAIFQKAFKFIGIKEFIFYRLFGIFTVDVSIASATGLMNAETGRWDSWVMDQLGLTDEKLSDIVEIDTVFSSPLLFPSLSHTAFVIGGSDGAMANIGATDEAGTLVITVGTSSAARVITDHEQMDAEMRTFCYRLKPRSWLVGGASNNGAIVLQWLKDNFFLSAEPVATFSQKAETVPPAADGLIFLPYLLGERAPLWNSKAKGVLYGIQMKHGRADMIRATMEGVIFCLYSISQPLFEKTAIHKIYASGGFARNELWLQILSDTFNLPVVLGETIENSAWGAAKTAGHATGHILTTASSISKVYQPVYSNHLLYAKQFQQFQRLYTLLEGEFK